MVSRLFMLPPYSFLVTVLLSSLLLSGPLHWKIAVLRVVRLLYCALAAESKGVVLVTPTNVSTVNIESRVLLNS